MVDIEDVDAEVRRVEVVDARVVDAQVVDAEVRRVEVVDAAEICEKVDAEDNLRFN